MIVTGNPTWYHRRYGSAKCVRSHDPEIQNGQILITVSYLETLIMTRPGIFRVWNSGSKNSKKVISLNGQKLFSKKEGTLPELKCLKIRALLMTHLNICEEQCGGRARRAGPLRLDILIKHKDLLLAQKFVHSKW